MVEVIQPWTVLIQDIKGIFYETTKLWPTQPRTSFTNHGHHITSAYLDTYIGMKYDLKSQYLSQQLTAGSGQKFACHCTWLYAVQGRHMHSYMKTNIWPGFALVELYLFQQNLQHKTNKSPH